MKYNCWNQGHNLANIVDVHNYSLLRFYEHCWNGWTGVWCRKVECQTAGCSDQTGLNWTKLWRLIRIWWFSPGVHWHGRRRKDWPNGWTDEVESSTQARLARPLSRTTQRSIFLTSLNLNSLAMFRRRIRTFWTGEESWLFSKRRLEQWWLLMRRTWSSGDSCGEWSSAVMLSSRLLTHVILCSLGWLNWVFTFDSSTFLLLL